ncbi:MAG: sigma-70 family RNA polymerase sigma factor [Lachnospiraceae bacterium]|nr:sigma-70 family RNA polymerase sigma factor [Lachnospiraceae bacterium]
MQGKEQFKRIYDTYGEMLYRVAYLYTGNSYDSEDLLQEVLIKYMTRILPFRDDEHEKAWLLRVMINQSKNLLKKSSKKEQKLSESELKVEDAGTEQHLDLVSEIGKLPFEYKTPIILYYYNDYSVAEIANIMKISPSAVKMRLKRARDMLKIHLEGYEYE